MSSILEAIDNVGLGLHKRIAQACLLLTTSFVIAKLVYYNPCGFLQQPVLIYEFKWWTIYSNRQFNDKIFQGFEILLQIHTKLLMKERSPVRKSFSRL